MEAAITDRRKHLVALARQSATEAPTLADVAPLLDRLPILADRLADVPQGELRALFDSLQLDVLYQPADNAADITLTLCDADRADVENSAQVRAEDWIGAPGVVPPAGIEPAHMASEANALSAELRGRVAGREPRPAGRSRRTTEGPTLVRSPGVTSQSPPGTRP